MENPVGAGDLLRAEKNTGSELADMINSCIKEGRIVSAEITVRLLRSAMEKSGDNRFLVDGFPRDMDNLTCWQAEMSSLTDLQFLLFLDCSEEVIFVTYFILSWSRSWVIFLCVFLSRSPIKLVWR